MISRRVLLASAGALALGACSARAEPAVAPAPPVPLRLSTRWSARPDGPLPATGDEGAPLQCVLSGSTERPAIRGGALVSNLPDAHSAAYLSQPLGQRLRRIGATFGFRPGDVAGSVALLAWTGSMPLSGHCHMVFTSDRWIAGVLVDGAVQEVDTAYYARPLVQDVRPYRVDLTFDGATVIADLPDGTRRTMTDPRFDRGDGVAACWEFYKNDAGSADSMLYETWAG
ncbi:hypothetical protein WCD74_01365 [Actinomycetospora sp. OC33-EN08]|uniref:Uncharacterized protein n=1 Tax=Actinomycetospora aurantiaca TaxID=3129233 RepID=A0ABU8MIV9_9PSEU